MGFSEMLQEDIDLVFLDTDEFAKEHNIDGEVIICIVDDDKSSQSKTDGVYVVRRRLFIKQADLGYRPEPDQKIMIDSQYLYVIDCIGEGLIEVILEARQT